VPNVRLRLRLYCDAVFVAGCVAVALLTKNGDLSYLWAHPLTFAVLGGGILAGEMLPLQIPRRGGDEEITLSTSFALALLLAGGLGPALVAQGAASILQDRLAGKPWWRVRFNLGQYALSMGAALEVMRLLHAAGGIGSSHPFRQMELVAVLVSAMAFFVVNNGLVGTAVASYQQVSVPRYFRNDVFFVVVTGGVLLMIAPLVVAAAAYSIYLVPLFIAPMLAGYSAVWQSERSSHAARHDALTGLPNRAGFQDAAELALGGDGSVESCLLLIDLDRFKDVNDTLGHHYGDILLRQVAERFRGQLGPDDHIARFGGDEFAIIGHGRPRDAALGLAHAIAECLVEPFEVEGMVVGAQASVGIALHPHDGTELERLLQKADVAMYRAKETRRDVALYDEDQDDHSPTKLALTAKLRSAIDEDQLLVWYQPELDLRSHRVVCAEALVRWQHPDLGLLSPDRFIDIAEQTNLIKPLTSKVLAMALTQAAKWVVLGIDVPVAVNISPHVLVDQGFVDQVLAALSTAGVTPDRLKLEVTESALMADPVQARSVLTQLNELGVHISIDDFGTGYSSLAYLADLPVSEVKIDRSFVSRMAVGSSETIIVNSTIDLAHHLGMRAVAEGVEEISQLDRLRSIGCDVVQGYAISRPMTPERSTAWLLVHQPADTHDGYAAFVP
jgi:diguanylate cyclase (GGDEF)-like protein